MALEVEKQVSLTKDAVIEGKDAEIKAKNVQIARLEELFAQQTLVQPSFTS